MQIRRVKEKPLCRLMFTGNKSDVNPNYTLTLLFIHLFHPSWQVIPKLKRTRDVPGTCSRFRTKAWAGIVESVPVLHHRAGRVHGGNRRCASTEGADVGKRIAKIHV